MTFISNREAFNLILKLSTRDFTYHQNNKTLTNTIKISVKNPDKIQEMTNKSLPSAELFISYLVIYPKL